MSFAHRSYPDIVRGLLATLTGGVIGEVHEVPPGGLDALQLRQRPVRRVSWLSGKVAAGDQLLDYRFTERDFELVATPERPDELALVRFKPGRKRPAPDTTLNVEYYPLRTPPTPLSDVAVGSVVRTLLETVARELATQYEQLKIVDDSAFIDSATSSALDRVVALLDVRRLQRGHPVAKVRFQRRRGEGSLVTLPIDTVVRDRKGARYFTTDLASMEPGQASVDVWVHGESSGSALVDAGELTILERAIAGVESVSNPDPAFRAAEAESDEQLRARARVAVHRSGRGTPAALRYGLMSLPFVSSVTLVEPPEVAAGTLRVDVALTEDNPQNRESVRSWIDELRPAGIQIDTGFAGRVPVAFDVGLELQGSTQPASLVTALQASVRKALVEHVASIPPGGSLRAARLSALVLQVDERIADAEIVLTMASAVVTGNATLPAAQVADVPNVSFRPVVFSEAGAADSSTVTLSAHLPIALSGGLTLAEARSGLQARIDALLLALQPGQTVDFPRMSTAVRNDPASSSDAGWIVSGADAIYTFTRADGTFSELRAAGGAFQVPAGVLLARGELAIEEAL